MFTTRFPGRRSGFVVAFTAALLALAVPAVPDDAVDERGEPGGKHYGIILMVGAPDGSGGTVVATEQECVVFRKTRACGETFCGVWQLDWEGQQQNRWTAVFRDVVVDSELTSLTLEGATQQQGLRSSIGGTGLMQLQAGLLSWSFAGVEMPRKACFEFAAQDE